MSKKESNNGSSIALQRNPWKVWMSVEPQPSAVLTNLYDLIFDENGELRADPASGKLKGTHLGHDISIYCSEYIEQRTGKIQPTVPVKTFYKSCFDLSFAISDLRAKTREISVYLPTNEIDPAATWEKFTFSIPDEDSILIPSTANEIYQSKRYTISSKNEDGTFVKAPTEFRTPSLTEMSNGSAYTVLPQSNANWREAVLVLSEKDPVFEASIKLATTRLAYTELSLNLWGRPHDLSLTPDTSPLGIINNCLKNILTKGPENYAINDYFFGNEADGFAERLKNWMNADQTGDPDHSKKAKDLLKHCYVWIKAPFAADYVNPIDYNQDLNQDASVIHKNLYTRELNGDYRRYKAILDNEVDDTNETRGYLPKNAPLKDFVSSSIEKDAYIKVLERRALANIECKTDDDRIKWVKEQLETFPWESFTVKEKIKILEEDAGFTEDTRIGGVLTEPTSADAKQNEDTPTPKEGQVTEPSIRSVVPIQFFDKEKTFDEKSLDTDYEKVPVIIPKNGNIWTDGRILSPTIDELWYVIKKLISGRPTDKDEITVEDYQTKDDDESGKILENEKDFPRVKGTDLHQNLTNTILSEVLDENSYKFEVPIPGSKTPDGSYKTQPVTGDPVDVEFTSTAKSQNGYMNSYQAITVTKYFTQPDTVVFTNYSEVLADEKTYKTHKADSDGHIFIKDQKVEGISRNEDSKEFADKVSPWALRPQPLSLREIEGRILNNKFNIEKTYKDFIESGAKVGKIGYIAQENSETDENVKVDSTAGSLYYLHRNYNYKDETPNTFYSPFGTGKNITLTDNGESPVYPQPGEGTDAHYGDLASLEESLLKNEGNAYLYKEDNGEFIRRGSKNYKKPIYRENYGKSETLRNEDDYVYGDSIYLSASGKWKAVNEYTRFPILRSRY